MPLYFFNVYDGQSAMDTEGTNLPDRQSVRRQALRFTSNLLGDASARLLPDEEWRLEVIDTAGTLLLTLELTLTEAPEVPDLMSSLG